MADLLVVDDDQSVRELVAATMELAGHEVVAVGSGPEALAAVAIHRPDAVVVDVMMPGMSGLEVVSALRGDATTADLPIVMLTAKVDDASTWQGWAAGASLYMTKPFDPVDLQQHVDRLLVEAAAATGTDAEPEPSPTATRVPRQVARGDLYEELRQLQL